jgi:hypothetical protein
MTTDGKGVNVTYDAHELYELLQRMNLGDDDIEQGVHLLRAEISREQCDEEQCGGTSIIMGNASISTNPQSQSSLCAQISKCHLRCGILFLFRKVTTF